MKKPRPVLALPVLAVAALGLTGCASISELVTHEKEQTFTTYDDAPQSGDLAFVPATFIPIDSTDLTIKVTTTGTDVLVHYSSATGVNPSLCAPGDFAGAVPALTAGWWPDETPTEGLVCEGEWYAFEHNDEIYAFG